MLSSSLPRRMMMGGGGGARWRTNHRIAVGVGGIQQCSCGSSIVHDDDGINARSVRWLANDSGMSNSNHQNYDTDGGAGSIRDRDRGGGMMRVYDSLSMSHKPLPMATNYYNDYDSITMAASSSSSSPPPSQFTTATATSTRGVAWYICGPTVYDSAHVGHGRTYVILDILRRVAMHHYHQYHGPGLLYVMNITDVDDKIIQRSATMTMMTTSSPSQSLESSPKSTHTKLDDPIALARHYEHEFWSDMDQLNVLRPNVICRVSEHVESTIVPYIAQIVQGGMAYVVVHEELEGEIIRMEGGDSTTNQYCTNPQGSVYFDVRAFESKARGRTRYGKLAPPDALSTTTFNSHTSSSNDTTTFFSWEKSNTNSTREGTESRNNEDEDDAPMVQRIMKRDPRDFCLWKYRPRTEGMRKTAPPPPPPFTTNMATMTALPPNNDDEAYYSNDGNIIEPESVSYNSPWGPGRPGWHVECSAMIHRLSQDFQDTHVFAVHAGGIDLRFPHHTNEIAQAEAHSMAGKDGEHNTNSGGGDAKNNNDGRIEEWMQHWLHTGHLHVKGRKMSKSLKNFITIREMLQLDNDGSSNDQNNAWHSPSDDFRLWCLGLSGSYRGPATYGKDRMEEARSVREKWVRFLIEGQECLEKWMETSPSSSCAFGDHLTKNANNDTSHSSRRLWDDDDLSLFRTVTLARVKCHAALMDDLDGATFVRELTDIAETGLAYVRQAMLDEENHSTNHERRYKRPEEPLRFVLDFVRSQLDLVGFSPQTVHAGLGVSAPTNVGTPALDEAVAFRAAVRSTALNAIRQTDGGVSVDALKDILGLCDKLRDETFPKLGVEILDGKIALKEDGAADSKRGWRHCPPRGSSTTNA